MKLQNVPIFLLVCWAPIQSVLLYKSVMDTADWDTSYISIVIQVTSNLQPEPSIYNCT